MNDAYRSGPECEINTAVGKSEHNSCKEQAVCEHEWTGWRRVDERFGPNLRRRDCTLCRVHEIGKI